jgi:hypothetical protein
MRGYFSTIIFEREESDHFFPIAFSISCRGYHCSFFMGFLGHQRINRIAVFTLPPQMLALYKPNIEYITAHAVDPDKRRYSNPDEAPRHYIDLDRYGHYPFDSLHEGGMTPLKNIRKIP